MLENEVQNLKYFIYNVAYKGKAMKELSFMDKGTRQKNDLWNTILGISRERL